MAGRFDPKDPNTFYIDESYNVEGGAQAYYDHVARSNNPTQADADLSRAGQVFRQRFEEVVGRAPDNTEFSNFFKDVLRGNDVALAGRPNDFRPVLNSYIQDNYGRLAEKEQEANLGRKAESEYQTVGSLIKSTLGRDATEAEIQHFAKLKASGAADDYTLGEALKTLPEYLQKQDATARDQLRGELSTADQRFFGDKILPSIQQRFAQTGRSVDSSGFASALANAAGALNTERETFLAGTGREDYVNRRQLAINSYLQGLERTQQTQDYSRARNDQLSDTYRNRAYEIGDFDTQQRAYQAYLENYGKKKKPGFLQSAAPLIGAGVGALAAGIPTGGLGAAQGAALGGQIGGMFSSY